MGKVSATEAEERLRELIRDANAASKDLSKATENAKREILEFAVPKIKREASHVIDVSVEVCLERLNDQITAAIKNAVSNVFDEFDALLTMLIGMDIRESVIKAYSDPDFLAQNSEVIRISEHTLAFAKAHIERVRTSRAVVEPSLLVNMDGSQLKLIEYADDGKD